MKKVLRSYNLVGLAAPQIGIPSRIIVMEASEQLKEKYPAAIYKARGCEILPMTVSDWSIEFDCMFAYRFPILNLLILFIYSYCLAYF